MRCEKYEELEEQLKSARSEYAYFALAENKQFRERTSDREANRLAKVAQGKQRHLSYQLSMHLQECRECRKPAL